MHGLCIKPAQLLVRTQERHPWYKHHLHDDVGWALIDEVNEISSLSTPACCSPGEFIVFYSPKPRSHYARSINKFLLTTTLQFAMAPTLLAETSTDQQLQAFISRTRLLLTRERDAEIKRSALLLTNCGQKVLEQKGLALGALGVAAVNVGLGGKTCAISPGPSSFTTSC